MIKIGIASTYSMQASTDRYSALVHTVAPLIPMTTAWIEMKFTFIEIVNNNKMTMLFIHNCLAGQCGCKS